MDSVNLRGAWQTMGSKSRRRRSHRDLRPETLTGQRTELGGSRQFKVGDRVAWDHAGSADGAVSGEIVSISPDDRWATVRTADGLYLCWPLEDRRLRYAETASYDTPASQVSVSTRTPSGFGVEPTAPVLSDRADSAYYAALDVEEEPLPSVATLVDLVEHDSTLPDGHRPTRRGR